MINRKEFTTTNQHYSAPTITRSKQFILCIILSLLLFGCSPNEAELNATINAEAVAIAATTIQALPTTTVEPSKTPANTYTPLPTLTERASYTPQATLTLPATLTPRPTLTANPTYTPLPTATATLTPSPTFPPPPTPIPGPVFSGETARQGLALLKDFGSKAYGQNMPPYFYVDCPSLVASANTVATTLRLLPLTSTDEVVIAYHAIYMDAVDVFIAELAPWVDSCHAELAAGNDHIDSRHIASFAAAHTRVTEAYARAENIVIQLEQYEERS